MRFARELVEDGFGDVVVAAPVGSALGQAELVEETGAVAGDVARARLRAFAIGGEFTAPAERAHRFDLRGCGRRRHHRGERQAEQAREPGFGDRGAAGGGIDHRLPLAQAAIAQRVQEQRTGEPVLEAAGRVRGLVLEIEIDAGERREAHVQQMGVGRARGLALQAIDRGRGPGALIARRGHASHGASQPSGWCARAMPYMPTNASSAAT